MKRQVRSSRLSRYTEKQTKKQFLFFGVGTIVIIFLLIQFSGFIVDVFGDIVFGIRGEDKTPTAENVPIEMLTPPSLFSLPNATPSAQLDIKGNSIYEDGTAILYLNNREVNDVNVKKDGSFIFRDVDLRNGQNKFQVRYKNDDVESELSEEYIVIRSNEEPKLEISSPSNDTTFTKADKRINVAGKTDPNNTVTVNGFRAVVNSSGEFSYLLELSEGDNNIKVEATNEAGVKLIRELKVIYRQN